MKRWLAIMGLLVPLAGVCQTSIVFNESTTYTSIGQGINLDTENSYNSHLLKNVLGGVNPGMQGTGLNIYMLNVGSVGSPANTTVVDYNTASKVALNQYAGGTWYGLCSAHNNFPGSVEICNGSGSNGFASGTVTSNTANTGSGATFVLGGTSNNFVQYDTIAIYGPSGATSSVSGFDWNCSTTGTGTCTIDTTSGNLYPGAIQAVQMCNGSSGTVALSATTDDFFTATANMIPISGTYTISLLTNIISGSGMTISANVARTGGVNSTATLSPTGSGWQTSSGSITGSETNTTTRGYLTVTYTLTATPGASSCVDVIDAQVTNNADTNASTFNQHTLTNVGASGGVTNAQEWRFSWSSDNLESLTNMLAVQAVRQGTNGQGGYNDANASLGLHDVLTAAKVAGEPSVWISLPQTFQQADFVNLVNYLAGTSGTYAALRATLGQTAAWTTVFKSIVLEISNEPWNFGSNVVLPGYSGCGTYGCNNYYSLSILDCGYLKTAAGWNGAVMSCQAGVQTGNQAFAHNLHVQDTSGYVDGIAVNQYTQASQTACTMQGLYTPLGVEAWADATDSSSASQLIYTCSGGEQCSVYEGQASPSVGSNCTQAQLVGFPEGLGFGITDPMYAALDNKYLGFLHWNFFDIYGYSYTTEAIWGIFGQANALNPHPAAYAMGMYNTCASLGTGYSATPTSPPTLNFSASNGVNAYSAAPLIQSVAFKNGSSRCVVVWNTDYSNTHAITFTGTNAPTSATRILLSSTNTSDNNESSIVVSPATSTVSFPNTLPAHSMAIFQFNTITPPTNFWVQEATARGLPPACEDSFTIEQQMERCPELGGDRALPIPTAQEIAAASFYPRLAEANF